MCHIDIDLCFFVKQETAYELRISDWSSDVCSSDLHFPHVALDPVHRLLAGRHQAFLAALADDLHDALAQVDATAFQRHEFADAQAAGIHQFQHRAIAQDQRIADVRRSEEHTSELQSLMRISYAVSCFKKKTN